MQKPQFALVGMFLLTISGCAVSEDTTDVIASSKAKCAAYGFVEGTDAFANCTMRLSQKQQQDNPDRETRIKQYREESIARRGDNRYPVCTASNMDAELDISTGKWVGPDCQMAP